MMSEKTLNFSLLYDFRVCLRECVCVCVCGPKAKFFVVFFFFIIYTRVSSRRFVVLYNISHATCVCLVFGCLYACRCRLDRRTTCAKYSRTHSLNIQCTYAHNTKLRSAQTTISASEPHTHARPRAPHTRTHPTRGNGYASCALWCKCVCVRAECRRCVGIGVCRVFSMLCCMCVYAWWDDERRRHSFWYKANRNCTAPGKHFFVYRSTVKGAAKAAGTGAKRWLPTGHTQWTGFFGPMGDRSGWISDQKIAHEWTVSVAIRQNGGSVWVVCEKFFVASTSVERTMVAVFEFAPLCSRCRFAVCRLWLALCAASCLSRFLRLLAGGERERERSPFAAYMHRRGGLGVCVCVRWENVGRQANGIGGFWSRGSKCPIPIGRRLLGFGVDGLRTEGAVQWKMVKLDHSRERWRMCVAIYTREMRRGVKRA